MTKEEDEKNNKKFLPLLLLLLGFVMIGGVSLAFFSDIMTGSANITAGTLDLQPADGSTTPFTFYLDADKDGVADDDEALTGLSVANFNPGDCVIAKGSAQNVGNKSAYVRSTVKLGTGTNNFPAGAVKVMAGAKTLNNVITSGTDIASMPTTGVQRDTVVINGTGTNAETEEDAISNVYGDEAFTICFDPEATNEAQAKIANLDFRVEAVQYRNNNGTGDAADWSDAEVMTTEFNLGA